MNFNELVQKEESELNEELHKKLQELRSYRFKASERQLKDVRALRNLKREIAQIRTALSHKSKA